MSRSWQLDFFQLAWSPRRARSKGWPRQRRHSSILSGAPPRGCLSPASFRGRTGGQLGRGGHSTRQVWVCLQATKSRTSANQVFSIRGFFQASRRSASIATLGSANVTQSAASSSDRPTRPERSTRALATLVPILTHWAMTPATLYIWGLGPRSRKSNFSPTRRRNSNFIAVSQRVLQLWSNRTWSTWLLFWSRKWPSEDSNQHFFPLRGLGEGCALWSARKSSLTWGRRAKNADFFTENWLKFGFSPSSPLATPMLDGLRTMTLSEAQGCRGMPPCGSMVPYQCSAHGTNRRGKTPSPRGSGCRRERASQRHGARHPTSGRPYAPLGQGGGCRACSGGAATAGRGGATIQASPAAAAERCGA